MEVMKLYVVTRGDLDPGDQATQACRAIKKFLSEFPEMGRIWFSSEPGVLVAVVPSEEVLRTLWQQVLSKNIRASALCDTTLQRRFTSLVLEHGQKSRRLMAKIPLSL